jgi:phage terminase small subunit
MTTEIVQQRGFTQKQRDFIAAIARGCSPNDAAKVAGYEPNNVNSYASATNMLLAAPHVLAAIKQEMTRVIASEDAPAARNVLITLMKDEKVAAPVRADCAKTILRIAGITEPKQSAANDKPLNEQSADELSRTIEQASKALGDIADRATPVNAPVLARGGVQDIDPFD